MCVAFLLLSIASFAYAASWDDDSHYVSLRPRNGYYIVRPDSRLYYQLGLYEAPVIVLLTHCTTCMERMRLRFDSIGTAY